jgi:hypothetical protein
MPRQQWRGIFHEKMKKFAFALMSASACLLGANMAQAATVVVANTATGGSISSFGKPDSQTYGQTFTAPITGILQSFTLYLNGGIGSLSGGVGTWNGSSTFSFGAGSPTNLYASAAVPSTSAGAYTFNPNIAVTAGSNYVAYLTAFGNPATTGTTSMPLGTSASGLGYFVWNNTSNPAGNSSWNYFFNAGSAQFSATFSSIAAAVPEPATWALMILGFGVVAHAMRRAKAQKPNDLALA